MKKFCLILIMIVTFSSLSYAQKTTRARLNFSQKNHRWSVYSGLLYQSIPLREVAVFQTADNIWYANQFPIWSVGSGALGGHVGGAYDYTLPNKLMFRVQTQFDFSGWIFGVIDLGMGARIPLAKNIFMTMEGYVSISQTGSKLGRIKTSLIPSSDQKDFYLAMFGFKGRMSFEFPLKNNYFISTYFAYAYYPWSASTVDKTDELYINGFRQDFAIDSLTIGIEFGKKF